MGRYAEIKDTIILNVFVADESFVIENKPDAIECPEGFGVGDKYEKGKFSRVVIVQSDETAIE